MNLKELTWVDNALPHHAKIRTLTHTRMHRPKSQKLAGQIIARWESPHFTHFFFNI